MTVLKKFVVATAFAFPIGSASAAIVFADDFNRQASNAVGNGWIEQESEPRDVSIVNRGGSDQQMQLQDLGPQAIASQLDGISTVGYSGIVFSYEWAPKEHAEAEDQLLVEWRNAALGGDWSAIASHSLANTGIYTPESFSLDDLAAGVADFELRFRLNVNANNEGVYVDNVVLSGTGSSRASQVPEPNSMALVVLALGLIGPIRRWKPGTAVQFVRQSHTVRRNVGSE